MREIWLNSESSKVKWGFIAKDNVRGSWKENYQEETSRVGGFLLNGPKRILAKDEPRISRLKAEDKELSQVSWVGG